MKKFISILLVFAMLAGVASLSVTAETEDYSVYPESEHDYQNDCRKTWKYVHSEEVEGLFVTFSADTYFERREYFNEELGIMKLGDYVEITTDREYEEYDIGYFSEDELASKTIYIPASNFSIVLRTDQSITAYGFKIDRIDTVMPENTNAICYNFGPNVSGIEKYYVLYDEGETVAVANNIPQDIYRAVNFRNGNEYRCGWATEPDGEYVYDDGAEITPNGGVVNLYASYTPLLIGADDVFEFGNSDYIFNLGDFDESAKSYYMTDEDHDMLIKNALKLGLPGLFFYNELKNYPHREFQGSCFGMVCSVFLQHNGVIDMLEFQEGAEKVKELKPTADVVSTVNYYQALTILSYLCQNQGYGVGTAEYKKQLKAVYDTVSGGTPVLMSILNDKRYIFGTNHSILVTGTYTDTKGKHYLLAYDGQQEYAEKNIKVYPVASDFSSFNNENAFYWTDDYTHLETFDMNGEGSVVNWYSKFVPNMGGLLKMLFSYLPVLLNK